MTGVTLKSLLNSKTHEHSESSSKRLEIPLNCSMGNQTRTCPTSLPTTVVTVDQNHSSNPACPEYFRWIHEDLRPWKKTGITSEMVERAKKTADFRLVIVNGRVYIEKYRNSFQTRDVFTWWGILQLLRRYPGRLPDLDLMFHCGDKPTISLSEYQRPNAMAPPPVFHYCGNNWTLGIIFPDWSFWGW